MKRKRELEFVSLSDPMVAKELAEIRTCLRTSQRIVGLIGAGASMSAGFDDFRRTGSIFQRLGGSSVLDEAVYRNTEQLALHYQIVRYVCSKSANAIATPFHQMFNGFARRGRLLQLLSQNIDGLTDLEWLYTDRPLTTRPGPYPNTTEIHGNARYQYCINCQWVTQIRLHLFCGDRPPACQHCEAEMEIEAARDNKRSNRTPPILKPWILLYGHDGGGLQAVNIRKLIDRVCADKPDLFIVGGTSLGVPGAQEAVKQIARAVHRQRGTTIWINPDEPRAEMQDYFDHILKGTCDQLASEAAIT